MAVERTGETAAEHLHISARARGLTNLFDEIAPNLLATKTRV